ncbi:exportin-6-like [Mercenaria mercenaria]|uniref:exportin-6-like n=1 Tax=Mercenaria mercenaria TaxID=6596 RepID=UPI00234F5D09|nr:exportin-6-like [Mercenaria mercenaria]
MKMCVFMFVYYRHAQALAAIKPFAHWLSQFYAESQNYPDQRQKFTDLITTLLDAITCLFEEQIPDKIAHSAAHLLLSLETTVGPKFLLQIRCAKTLQLRKPGQLCHCFLYQVQVLLYRFLSLHLLLPWNNVPDSEQDWSNLASTHQSFCHQMAAPYFHLKDISSLINNKTAQDAAKLVISNSLKLMIDWIECVSGEVVKTKQICYQSMSEIVSISLAVFPVFIHQPGIRKH